MKTKPTGRGFLYEFYQKALNSYKMNINLGRTVLPPSLCVRLKKTKKWSGVDCFCVVCILTQTPLVLQTGLELTWDRLTGCPGCTLLSTASHIIMTCTPSLALEEVTRSGLSTKLSTTSNRRCSVSNCFTAARYSCIVFLCVKNAGEGGGGRSFGIECLPATPGGGGVSRIGASKPKVFWHVNSYIQST